MMLNTIRPTQAQAVTDTLLDVAYATNRTVAGADLLSVTPYKQANLLLVFGLKNKWTDEANRLRSPYFDYEHKDVADAMRRMLNTLSQHISIERAAMATLLQDAILETAALIDSPAAAITRMAEPLAKPAIKLADLQAMSKYIVVHGEMLQALLKELASLGATEVLKGDLQRQLKQLEDRLPTNTKQRLFGEFSLALGIKEVAPEPVALPAPAPAAEPSEPENFFDALTLVEADSKQPFASPTAEGLELIAEPDHAILEIVTERKEHTNNALPVAETTQVAVVEEPKPMLKAAPMQTAQPKDAAHTNTKLSELHLTDTLVERLGTAPGDDALYHKISTGSGPLRNAIPIGERYMLVNALFRGDNLAYLSSLERLDGATGQADALNMLRNTLADQYRWDVDSDAYKALETVVKRKFAA